MSKRSYNKSLIKDMNDRCYTTTIENTNVIMKPIPETNEIGVLDPRFYKKIKSIASLTKYVPDQVLKLSPRKQIIEGLKMGFDLKKSKTMTEDSIKVDQITIRGKDNNLLPLRIYHPANKEETAPILYYIHGGGFFSGNLDVCDEYLRYLCIHFNILIFSVDYRLAPQYPYPKGHEDCYEGLKWVSEHADYYQGDLNSIFIAGDSAGGNLVHYCVLKDRDEQRNVIKGQFLLYPTLDLACTSETSEWSLDKYEINKKQEAAVMLSIQLIKNGGVDIMKGVLNADVNHEYLTPCLSSITNLPPTLICVGEYDYLKVENLAYTIKNHNIGNPVEMIVYKGMGHGFADFIGYFPQSEDSVIELGNFILKHSKRIQTEPRKLLSEEQIKILQSEDTSDRREYSRSLISTMNRKSRIEILDNNPVIVKPMMDEKEKEKLDKHVVSDIRAQEFFIHLASDIYNNIKIDDKVFEEIRKFFNEIKSLPIASNHILVEDISITGIDGNEIPLRIYHPATKNKNKSIFYFIHGGAFVAGSNLVVEQFVKYIVEKFNVVAFSVNYRLAPENPFPKGHEDCYSALLWIHKYAHLIHGDTKKLYVVGDSAGGNLAQYCVLRSLNENGPKIKGQMLLYPTVDLVESSDQHIEWENAHFETENKHTQEIHDGLNSFRKYLNQFMRKALSSDGDNEYLSPYLADRKDLPPTLLAVGEYDFLKIECLAYMGKLHKNGIQTRTILYEGFSHGFIDSIGHHMQSEDLAIEVGNFIKTLNNEK
ncbi:alpha/beta hydrolase [Anaerorhabdus sp.]